MSRYLTKVVMKNLRRVREERSMTKAAFAKKVGVDPSRYGEYESGKVEARLSTLERISKKLDINPLEFFREP